MVIIVLYVFQVVLLSPCALGKFENCSANKCIVCLNNNVPDCTILPLKTSNLYNLYCEAPSNCTEENVSINHFCVALIDRDNNNGGWRYQASKFSFQQYQNCSNIDDTFKLLPNCLHLYYEVSTLKDIGQNVVCFCYEDDCQKRINATVKIVESSNINVSTSSQIFVSQISPSTSVSYVSPVDMYHLSSVIISSSTFITQIPHISPAVNMHHLSSVIISSSTFITQTPHVGNNTVLIRNLRKYNHISIITIIITTFVS